MVQNLHISKDEFTEEVVNQLIEDNNITIKLTAKRKRLLAVLLYLNGLDDKDEQGRFFIDNLWLSKFIGITETNLLVALRYFISNGIIERESGSNHNCSRYKIINEENNSIDDKNNSTNQKTVVQNNSINEENNSRDIDKELDIEKEKDIYNIINKINNIIKENNNNLINIIEEKENNIINNIIKEKETSIEINTKENNTQMEEQLQQQINELKEQNEILTSRLNNCGRQFKKMMNTIAKLQQEINELKKENKTSSELNKVNKEETPTINVIVEPTTASIEQDDTDSQPIENKALEAKKEVFLSPIEELNETFDAEAIVEEFKKSYTDAEEAQAKQIELIKTFKDVGLNYYNCCELKSRISKYIQSLELISSTVQQEVPSEDAKEVEEVIESGKEDKATEEKESTFVETFQEVKSNSVIDKERLRYQDLKSKLYYSSLEEAQAAEVNPMYLYDYEVSRCVSTFN